MKADEKTRFLRLLGANIRYYREVSKMSQEQLGHKSGYNTETARSAVSKVESGKYDIPVSRLIAISAALNVGLEDLIPKEKDYEES